MSPFQFPSNVLVNDVEFAAENSFEFGPFVVGQSVHVWIHGLKRETRETLSEFTPQPVQRHFRLTTRQENRLKQKPRFRFPIQLRAPPLYIELLSAFLTEDGFKFAPQSIN